jgi:hypothetical protein
MSESYINLGPDPANQSTHTIILVGNKKISVFNGTEKHSADAIIDSGADLVLEKTDVQFGGVELKKKSKIMSLLTMKLW